MIWLQEISPPLNNWAHESPRQDIMTIEALDPDTLTWEVKFPIGLVVGPVGGWPRQKVVDFPGVPGKLTVKVINYPNFG